MRINAIPAAFLLGLAITALTPAAPSQAEPLPPGVNPDLPVHQQPKRHPELADPVLGDRAAVVEWAWSPQYARCFGVPVQADGLKDGPLWLVGVKVLRLQAGERQTYHCRIAGLIDNRLAILWPPGEQYMIHLGYQWAGGLPGHVPNPDGLRAHSPAQAAWYKQPKNKLEETRPETSITLAYLAAYRNFTDGLSYFEIDGACAYFRDPQQFRNELRFPTTLPGDPNGTTAFHKSASTFDLPDGLMRKIYPYTREAEAWSGCLLRRIDGKRSLLPLWANRRFKGLCGPSPATQTVR